MIKKWNNIDIQSIMVYMIVLMFCIVTAIGGHIDVKINTFSVLFPAIVLIISSFVFLHKKIDLKLVEKEILLFPVIIGIEFVLRFLLRESYYSFQTELIAICLYIVMILSVLAIGLTKKEKAIWSAINQFAILNSIIIIFQFILSIWGLRLEKMGGMFSLLTGYQFQFYRPCALFSEPSHFAELGLLSVYYYFFISEKKHFVVIVIAGCILSTSSLGVLGCFLIYVLYIISIKETVKKNLYRYLLITFLLIILAVVGIWMLNTDNAVVQRTMQGSTSSVRVARSFELFSVMDWYYKFLGIGIQNQTYYLNANSIILPSDAAETLHNREFAQTFGYILCTTGIVGITAFFSWIIKNCIQGDYKIRFFSVIFTFVMLTCCIFSRVIFVIYLLIFFIVSHYPVKMKKKTQLDIH